MMKMPEDLYTVLKFVEVDCGGRIYRGENMILELGDSSLDGFQKALEELKTNYQRLHVVADDWEVLADLALGKDWSERSLSELLAEVQERGIDVVVMRKRTVSNILDGTNPPPMAPTGFLK
jgi:hypothetical protein